MSKVLIVSDSHGLTKELEELKKKLAGEVDLMIHCGDSELPFDHQAISGFVTVRGNCDYETRYKEDIVQKVGNFNIFVTHGHLYSVKTSLMGLQYRAQELNANIVCFGHSHILGVEQVGDILYINPGSLRLPRRRHERTYVVLEMIEENISLQVFDFDQGEIMSLRQNFLLPKK
ncbi:metallophosphoesterase (plasmid) [Bacillus sp. 31A1R]|uniref:Phosphoesterase n=1 Tax=Robertmurraya mangrovi TaxID=3098077 RepID=A0ABU5IUE9_9BACI|nr:metallophosphoesterase [Bacillus sp. 31A1R]MDZ5470768.1 metallophosphoesterase [Bacillus sp. 31A1R]